MVLFSLSASLWYRYYPLPICPSLLTPLSPSFSPSRLWPSVTNVLDPPGQILYKPWALGLNVNASGSSLPCFYFIYFILFFMLTQGHAY